MAIVTVSIAIDEAQAAPLRRALSQFAQLPPVVQRLILDVVDRLYAHHGPLRMVPRD